MFVTKMLFYIVLILSVNQCLADVIVSLPKGDIRGHEIAGVNDSSFYAFQEIPFAAPPIGSLRFQPPVEPASWDGVLNTTENTKICYQFLKKNNARQTEDCLYLNVYTPVKPGSVANKSVLVFFYGGTFKTGDASIESFGPQHFVYKDLVVVTTNYRLGPFGFLSTQDTVIPGNQALKDQLLALKWVKQNIHLFGGDPEKVTINGQSAGAALTGFHLVSKQSAGLFRAAILESGTSICSWAIQPEAKRVAYILAQAIDSQFTINNTSEELLRLLQNASADAINTVNIEDLYGIQIGQGNIYAPVIEPEHDGAFVTDYIHESFKNGNFNIVPTIVGFNSAERISEAANLTEFKELMAKYDANLTLIVNGDFNILEENKLSFGEKLRQVYTSGLFEDDLVASVQFKSDARYTTSVSRQAYLQSNYTDVYLYQFSYDGKLGGIDIDLPGPDKVGHHEEVGYLWDLPKTQNTTIPEEDLLIRERFLRLFANFVQYLNPTPEPMELLQNITWPAAKPNNLQYLNINSTLEVKVGPKQYKSYTALVEEYGNPPFVTY